MATHYGDNAAHMKWTTQQSNSTRLSFSTTKRLWLDSVIDHGKIARISLSGSFGTYYKLNKMTFHAFDASFDSDRRQ